jgi:hypothetical protein
MSEENLSQAHKPGEGFETEDLNPLGVLYFMAGLAIVGLVIYFIVLGMYRFLDSYDQSHQPPTNPMAVTTGVHPQTMTRRDIQRQIDKTFPKPVLEYSERTQFTEEIERQDKALESYDWVDPKNGVVHIPIERAMDVIAQRGLPVLPEGEAGRAVTKTETKGKAGKGTASPKRDPTTKGQLRRSAPSTRETAQAGVSRSHEAPQE